MLDRNTPWDTNKLCDVMDLASAVLDARLERAPSAAVVKWRHAVRLQDALLYDASDAFPFADSDTALEYRHIACVSGVSGLDRSAANSSSH